MRPTLRYTLEALRLDATFYPEGWRVAGGFWCSAAYRVRRLRKYGPRWCRVLLPLDLALGALRWLLRLPRLPASADIGPGLALPHPEGLVIHDRARIGARCVLFHRVTIGQDRNGGVPTLGDGVVVYCGAVIAGAIAIGDRAEVSANAVVTRSVHKGMTVPSPKWSPQ